jgi:aconitate hydratase
VLSGNRNFEGRISPDVKMNYLASPPLVIVYALAGTMDIDWPTEPLGRMPRATRRVHRGHLADHREIEEVIASAISAEMFERRYADVFAGDDKWRALPTPDGEIFEWDAASTYVRKPPYFDGMPLSLRPGHRHRRRTRAAEAGRLGDHRPHQPGGRIKADTPAGEVPDGARCRRKDFNSWAHAAATTRS